LHAPDCANESDSLIAAPALVHGLAVVTRNTNDFQSSGVSLVNPWGE
jgi:predicted nucleic acid-binding protein